MFRSIRSERQLLERLDYNLLFRGFVSPNMDDQMWDHSSFGKNRGRPIAVDVARRLMLAVVEQARDAGLVSGERFSIGGTRIEAWASKRVSGRKTKWRRPTADATRPSMFYGERRFDDTHACRAEPESRLCRMAKGKKQSFPMPVLMENRNGFVADGKVSLAIGTVETALAW